jgi:hypothetical protein
MNARLVTRSDGTLAALPGRPTAVITTVHAVRRARIDLEHTPGTWTIGVDGTIRVTAHRPVPSDQPIVCAIPAPTIRDRS